MFLIDSHCHFDALNYEKLHIDIDDVMKKAAESGVKHCLAVATTLQNSAQLFDWLGGRHDISLSCGVHPLNLDDGFDADTLNEQISQAKRVAVGEIGLDYYYQQDNMLEQQRIFAEQIEIAAQHHKPVIVHTRQAQRDTLAILQCAGGRESGGVLHCFTEDIDFARVLLDIGFYISFSGILTFRNAQQIRDVAQYVPLDRILIETDSPYLAPVPYRGKENQPAYVRAVAEYLAVLKGCDVEEIAMKTTQNFCQLFNVRV